MVNLSIPKNLSDNYDYGLTCSVQECHGVTSGPGHLVRCGAGAWSTVSAILTFSIAFPMGGQLSGRHSAFKTRTSAIQEF